MLEDLSIYKKYHPGEGIMAPQMIKEMIKKTEVDRQGVIEQLISSARHIKKADESAAAYKKQIVDSMVEKGADKEMAEMFADSMSKAIDIKGTPKITEEGLLELETIYKNMLMKEGRKPNATGGRVPLGGGGIALKIIALLKNPKKIRAAVDDIFPTGDYKYDADMVAESLVENNPKVFKNRLYDDLTDSERSAVYGAGLEEASTNFAKALQLKRAMDKASKPTKTLKSIEKTGTIDISDAEVASEFARFMKETDPKGHKKLEQTVDLMNLDPKGKKGHASGGVAGMLGE